MMRTIGSKEALVQIGGEREERMNETECKKENPEYSDLVLEANSETEKGN